MAVPKIIGWRGRTDFLIDAGRGDSLGMIDTPLGQVYDLLTGKLGDPISVEVLAGRGYWEDASTIPEGLRIQVEQKLDPDSALNKALAQR